MLRFRITLALSFALAHLLLSDAHSLAFADPPLLLTMPGDPVGAPDESIADAPMPIDPTADGTSPLPQPQPPDSPPGDEFNSGPPNAPEAFPESDSYFSKLRWLGLRHSSINGRNAGVGVPLTGTSWLNRPYYLGGQIGTVWVTRPINSDLTTDTDMFGGAFVGCDWDYYWGTELAVNRATPEIINEKARDANRGDRMMQQSISLLYYPWGDALFRPYWRWGIGATEIDYPTDKGHRRDEALWTFPIGLGLKYPLRRFLATRIELTDAIALGNDGVATQHDVTLTLGLEWRFGVHPRSYWPWNPSRHIW